MLFSAWSPNPLLSAGSYWIVPAIGAAACGLAFFVGRLISRSTGRGRMGPDELVDISFLGGITRDRRSAPRRKGNTIEVRLRLGEMGPVVRGWVVDRSIGGLGLLVDGPVPTGVEAGVRPCTDNECVPWTTVTICSCRQEGPWFEVGCQFHHVPSWNDMLQFG